MAFSTAKLSELPLHSSVQLRSHSSLKVLFSFPKSSFFVFRPLSSSSASSPRTTERRGHSDDGRNPKNRRYPWSDENHRRNTTISQKPKPPSSPWLKKWPSSFPVEADTENNGERRIADSEKRLEKGGDGAGSGYVDGDRGRSAIERIVHRLRNLGLGSDDDDDDEEGFVEGDDAVLLTGEEKLGDLLKRTWSRPDSMVSDDKESNGMVLPWDRPDEENGDEEGMGSKKQKRRVKAPTLAELTIEDAELRRLRTLGMTLRERINIPKAGVTQVILEKIHENWRKSELVRLKFHETLAHDMKTGHEIVEVCGLSGLPACASNDINMQLM